MAQSWGGEEGNEDRGPPVPRAPHHRRRSPRAGARSVTVQRTRTHSPLPAQLLTGPWSVSLFRRHFVLTGHYARHQGYIRPLGDTLEGPDCEGQVRLGTATLGTCKGRPRATRRRLGVMGMLYTSTVTAVVTRLYLPPKNICLRRVNFPVC